MASTESIETSQKTSAGFIQSTLANVDRAAPLTVDILARLMQAQSEFLIDSFNKQISERDNLIASQNQAIDALKTDNLQLRADLDELQQYSRRNSIRISGIPEAADEKPEDIHGAVKGLFVEKLKVNLDERDICRMHRVGKPNSNGTSNPRQILLKFTRYGARLKVMKARKLLRNDDPNGEDQTDGRPKRVYINEDLTRKRVKVAKLARDAKRMRKIKETWVYDGKIFLKLKDDTIKVVTDEVKLQGVLSVC